MNVVCTRCDQVIDEKKDKNRIEWNNKQYHEECFRCYDCKSLLKNKMVYTENSSDEFFCSKCMKKRQKKNNTLTKRCFRCKNKFSFDMNYIEFNGKFYHEQCFTCSSCQKSIVKENFYPNKTKLLCDLCYEMTLEICELCKERINNGDIIIFQDKKYHESCMRCAKCKGSIGGKICFLKNTDGSFICRSCDDKNNK